MNAIMVAVDYTDILSITLPYNRHHFDRVVVVTDTKTNDTDDVFHWLCHDHSCDVFPTDSFYANGAEFNKWLALEEGLDHMGRRGWICLMDADVLWPRDLRWGVAPDSRSLQLVMPDKRGWWWSPGHLISPLRRMLDQPPVPWVFPPENTWGRLPIHHNVNEWAGYTQIFHADDPALRGDCAACGHPYAQHYSSGGGTSYGGCTGFKWHQTDWRHAGGADSFFQQRWDRANKVRPPFEVLHIGPAGYNWCGRTTSYMDGRRPAQADERFMQLRQYLRRRRQIRDYSHERL